MDPQARTTGGRAELAGCKRALLAVGVFPIRNHYYEPQFDFSTSPPDRGERSLPGIDWNIAGQLALLERLTLSTELQDIDRPATGPLEFSLDNKNFVAGDAEVWYQMVRYFKPRRIIEIGSGHSTLLALGATRANMAEEPAYTCSHTCVEPYEMPWLSTSGVKVVRERVETLGIEPFLELQHGDILFIDSSHIIRPDGDVLTEYLEILPRLNIGVIVHVHDIFSPRNYLKAWMEDKVLFWNEQYLLEAFLSHNTSWRVLASLNLLHHRHFEELANVAPYLQRESEPGSFYMQRVS